MKKLVLIILLSVPILNFAQRHSAAINLGHFNPVATEGGFILGYEGGKFIDRNLSFGWSIDWFHKKFVDNVFVEQFEQYYGVVDGEITEKRATTNLHSIPLMANITAYLPLTPFISAYVTGAAGAEALLIFYKNLENPNKDEFKNAWDFSWEAGTGLLYELGNRSDLFAEVSYHDSNPSWTYEIKDPETGKLKTLERSFDMSGVAVKFGVKFLW